jgi:tRNA pseudouridine55 synthase
LKRTLQRVDGVVLLDKPSGITSNGALQRVRRAFCAQKAGHTGTLDPMATGLLPVCLGEATKFSAFLLDADKTYLATLRFGITTATGDAEGEVVERRDTSALRLGLIEAVLRGMQGELEQVPPMYSALKHQGRALYEYARAGETVERASRRVMLYEVEVLEARADTAQARVRLRVSKGTYIRSVAEEAGRRLGCGGHLAALRREATGGLHVRDAVALEALEGADEAGRLGFLHPVDSLVQRLPRVELPGESARALQLGQSVQPHSACPPGLLRVYGEAGRFLGVGEGVPGGRVAPRRLVAAPAREPA